MIISNTTLFPPDLGDQGGGDGLRDVAGWLGLDARQSGESEGLGT